MALEAWHDLALISTKAESLKHLEKLHPIFSRDLLGHFHLFNQIVMLFYQTNILRSYDYF